MEESYLFVFLEGSRRSTEGKNCTLQAGSFGEATIKLQEWLNEHCMGVTFDLEDFISCGYHHYNNVYLVK